MVLSHDDIDPIRGLPGISSLFELCSDVYRSGRDQHSCASLMQSMSKDRASQRIELPPPGSSARVRADASETLRHTSCSVSCSMTQSAAERVADKIESSPMSSKGFGFVRDGAVVSFIGAPSPLSFSRMEARSERSDRGCFERIVRQPSRRDSQCVPK